MAEIPELKRANIEALILSKFSPASSEAEADLLLTTDDIIQRIVEYNGVEYDKESIVLLMEELGFKCVPDSQMHFVWLFTEN